MSTKEKQATPKAAFVFRAISERAACVAGGKARQRGLVSEREHTRKTSDAEGGICFSCAIRERAACVAGDKARQRGLVI